MTISAVIITHNEAANIGRCLASLEGVADEVVVVDSGSTDATPTICRQAGAHFVSHAWEGYSAQKNYANSLATCDWVLSLDADEALSQHLRQSILDWKRIAPSTGEQVVAFNRLTHFCGKPIRHCGWYPDCKVRLWPRGVATWDGVVHEELRYTRQVSVRRVEGDLLHYSYHSAHELASRQVHYASLAADKAASVGKRVSVMALVCKPFWTFLRNYLFKGGFRDGYAGWVVCRMSAYYTFLKYILLKEKQQSSRT